MLKEFIENPQSIFDFSLKDVASGIKLCAIDTTQDTTTSYPIALTPTVEYGKVEIFLCTAGSLMIERKQGIPLTVKANEILLLSNEYFLHSALIACPVQGFFIYIDKVTFKKNLHKLNLLFTDDTFAQMDNEQLLAKSRDCYILENSIWTQALFRAMHSATHKADNFNDYIVLKLIELMYLIHNDNNILIDKTSDNYSDSYLIKTVMNVKTYMERHLEEKHTIKALSKKFHIASTSLKINFNAIYGQSIHSYLQDLRMKRASEMLYTTNMTTLQIAQLVGYEGVSQFNVIFKRYYGVTPGQYRKMSNSIKI